MRFLTLNSVCNSGSETEIDEKTSFRLPAHIQRVISSSTAVEGPCVCGKKPNGKSAFSGRPESWKTS